MDDQSRFNLDKTVALIIGYKVVHQVIINGREYLGTFYWPSDYGNPLDPGKRAILATRPPCFSSNLQAFEQVLEWIAAQPDWEWSCSYTSGELKAGAPRKYAFSVLRPDADGFLRWYDAQSDSSIEEAGCMALLNYYKRGANSGYVHGDLEETANEHTK